MVTLWRGAFTPPDFVRSVNPISISGSKIMLTTLLLATPDFQTCLRSWSELTSYLGMDPTSQRQKTFLKVQIRRCTSRHFSCFSAAPYQLVHVKKLEQFGDIFFLFSSVFCPNVTFPFRKLEIEERAEWFSSVIAKDKSAYVNHNDSIFV